MRQTIRKIADLSKVKNGLIDSLFRTEIGRLRQDLIDRPGMDTARKVMIEVSFIPICGQTGLLESVRAKFEVSSKIPKQCTDEMSMLCGDDGEFIFNDLSPDNVRQGTLDEA